MTLIAALRQFRDAMQAAGFKEHGRDTAYGKLERTVLDASESLCMIRSAVDDAVAGMTSPEEALAEIVSVLKATDA